jgi:hypothetical protein
VNLLEVGEKFRVLPTLPASWRAQGRIPSIVFPERGVPSESYCLQVGVVSPPWGRDVLVVAPTVVLPRGKKRSTRARIYIAVHAYSVAPLPEAAITSPLTAPGDIHIHLRLTKLVSDKKYDDASCRSRPQDSERGSKGLSWRRISVRPWARL